MLDIKWIRDNPEALDRALANRRAEPQAARLIALDEARRKAIAAGQAAQERRNTASKEIGKAKAAKDEARAAQLMAEVAELKTSLPAAEAETARLEKELRDALAMVPNIPQDGVPIGSDEHANVEYRRSGAKPSSWPTDFTPREHFEIGEGLGGMDFGAAAKLSGARFVVLKGQVARLERALGQFMLDLHTGEHGYVEVAPPLLVKDDVAFGTGQLPKFQLDLFKTSFEEFVEADEFEVTTPAAGAIKIHFKGPRAEALASGFRNKVFLRQGDFLPFTEKVRPIVEADRWLIPTAEVPLTNLVRESIVTEDQLPIRYTALTPCFRSEAGASGRDTRGMLRQHQFDKVELVSITTPEQSVAEHERMLSCAEEVLKRLDLHYRVMTLSTGDMGFASRKTWDIEVWLPGQGTYREISSCSNCGDFQARRMEARYRGKDGNVKGLVHTLNGSGVAVGRALIAVLENYQNPDGTVTVPSALARYMGDVTRITAPAR